MDVQDHEYLVTNLLQTVLGDANLNGTADFADFLNLAANFNQAGGWADGNFTTNTLVDFEDFLVLSANFRQAAKPAASVPEPSGTMLLLFGVIAIGATPFWGEVRLAGAKLANEKPGQTLPVSFHQSVVRQLSRKLKASDAASG